MTGQKGRSHPFHRISCLAAVLTLSSIALIIYYRPKQEPAVVAVERLVEQFRTDPEQIPGEARSYWFRRIGLRNLDLAEEILAHPQTTAEQQATAMERKLVALSVLAGRDPDRYMERWREFANRLVAEHPGTPLAREAAASLLNRKISDDPADPEIVAEIERFARTYPDSGSHAHQHYYRLTGLLYEHDPERALGILDRAITTVLPELAASLRQRRDRLTMIGSRLPMSWPKLEGGQLLIDDLRGKVVLMYSWSTGCVPCVENFPLLNELHANYHARGFEIVAVCQNDDPADAVKFLQRKGLAGIHVLRSEEYEEKYGFMGLPGSLLIDREGTVADRALFGRDEIETAIKRLLEMPAAENTELPSGASIP
jgi:thiol-disulfide isomerase/thioredoxin